VVDFLRIMPILFVVLKAIFMLVFFNNFVLVIVRMSLMAKIIRTNIISEVPILYFQFNTILIYLHANSTAQGLITK
jgi:hypothetical protein